MKKQELLDDLAGRYYKVGVIQDADPNGKSIRAIEGVAWKSIGVYDVMDNTMIRKNIFVYIVNEDTENEEAYYAETAPQTRVEVKEAAVQAAAAKAIEEAAAKATEEATVKAIE